MRFPWEEEGVWSGISYRISPGTGKERFAVLMHGIGGNMNAWDMVAEMLHFHGIGTIRIDLPGHGMSRPVRRPWEFTLDGIASDISELVGHLLGSAWKKAVFVAHSFSNLLLPFIKPKSAAMVSPPYMKSKKLARVSFLSNMFMGIGYVFGFAAARKRHEYDFSGNLPDIDIARFIRDTFPCHLSSFMFGFSLDIPDFSPLRGRNILIIHGKHDSLVSPLHARILSLVLSSSLVLLEGNHILPINNWREVSDSIISFFF